MAQKVKLFIISGASLKDEGILIAVRAETTEEALTMAGDIVGAVPAKFRPRFSTTDHTYLIRKKYTRNGKPYALKALIGDGIERAGWEVLITELKENRNLQEVVNW